VAGKTDKPKKPEPARVTEARTFGEALEEMGFVPLNRPRRIIRQGTEESARSRTGEASAGGPRDSKKYADIYGMASTWRRACGAWQRRILRQGRDRFSPSRARHSSLLAG